MDKLLVKTAQVLVAKAFEKAAADYGKPISAAVCDEYGFLVAFGKMDDAPVRGIAISQGKAYTAARMQVNTDAFLQRLHRENIPAIAFCDEKLTGMAGGSVIKNAAGKIIGAAGVSGLKPEEDQVIANMMAALIETGAV
jgi:glc operon protein GlcG